MNIEPEVDRPNVGREGPGSDEVTGWKLTWIRFRRERVAMWATGIVMFALTVSILAPLLAPYALGEGSSDFTAPPSSDHWLGTNNIGYDTFSQLLYGMRTSFAAASIAVSMAVIIGSTLGLISGYTGGWPDRLIMRLTDAVMAFPGLLLAMAVVGVLGPGIVNAMIGLSFVFAPNFVRLVRGQVLALREESYVEAAQVIGCGRLHIARVHIVPNVLAPLVVQGFMTMGFALVAEGALAFLGLSVQPPEISLGSMIRGGFAAMNATFRLALVPGLAITILSVSFNAIADGLRDAMGRRTTGEHLTRAG